jgi:hypothetical protein
MLKPCSCWGRAHQSPDPSNRAVAQGQLQLPANADLHMLSCIYFLAKTCAAGCACDQRQQGLPHAGQLLSGAQEDPHDG